MNVCIIFFHTFAAHGLVYTGLVHRAHLDEFNVMIKIIIEQYVTTDCMNEMQKNARHRIDGTNGFKHHAKKHWQGGVNRIGQTTSNGSSST